MHLIFVLAAFVIAAAAPMMIAPNTDITADAEMLEQWTDAGDEAEPQPSSKDERSGQV